MPRWASDARASLPGIEGTVKASAVVGGTGMLLVGLSLLSAGACGSDRPGSSSREVPRVLAPTPAAFARGESLYLAHCDRCHGHRATGSEIGPPLVHSTYEPRHHADAAFVLAVRNGVRAHHWPFGDMPPVPGLSEDDVASIVAYVRWLQREAGIN